MNGPRIAKAEYLGTVLPGTNPMVWVDTCALCGALVVRRDLHDAWHFPPVMEES